MVTTTTNNRVNLEQVCSLNIEQSRLLQYNGYNSEPGAKLYQGLSARGHIGAINIWNIGFEC